MQIKKTKAFIYRFSFSYMSKRFVQSGILKLAKMGLSFQYFPAAQCSTIEKLLRPKFSKLAIKTKSAVVNVTISRTKRILTENEIQRCSTTCTVH